MTVTSLYIFVISNVAQIHYPLKQLNRRSNCHNELMNNLRVIVLVSNFSYIPLNGTNIRQCITPFSSIFDLLLFFFSAVELHFRSNIIPRFSKRTLNNIYNQPTAYLLFFKIKIAFNNLIQISLRRHTTRIQLLQL